jgi:hypothetical protein
MKKNIPIHPHSKKGCRVFTSLRWLLIVLVGCTPVSSDVVYVYDTQCFHIESEVVLYPQYIEKNLIYMYKLLREREIIHDDFEICTRIGPTFVRVKASNFISCTFPADSDCVGNYNIHEGITVSSGMGALLHEILHSYEVHGPDLISRTLSFTHRGWDQNGYNYVSERYFSNSYNPSHVNGL